MVSYPVGTILLLVAALVDAVGLIIATMILIEREIEVHVQVLSTNQLKYLSARQNFALNTNGKGGKHLLESIL
jgi:hypothetical protein